MADGAKRVQKHRDKMKAAGFKPVTIWVPDVNAPGFKEQIGRDIAIINADADSHLVMEQMLALPTSATGYETRRHHRRLSSGRLWQAAPCSHYTVGCV
jgi:hypothetical protein